MSSKYKITLLFATSLLFASTFLTSAEIISCSSFEQCEAANPALVARIELLESQVASLLLLVDGLDTSLTQHTGDPSAHHDRYTDAEASAAVGPHFSGDHADLINVTSGQHHADQEPAVTALETLLAGVSRANDANGYDTLAFTDMNIQIVNGTGATGGGEDGRGNLIIGYNGMRGDTECPDGLDCNRRTGSHNLIIGDQQNYTSSGGTVAGVSNEISGSYASVSGGSFSTASGSRSSISGGSNNKASGEDSSVSGGDNNEASGLAASVSGGNQNVAIGNGSSVSGGNQNVASGSNSSVSGGDNNEASGFAASVSGGNNNKASGNFSSVSGGTLSEASGLHSSVSGGGVNIASGVASSVSGGVGNEASGQFSSVSGGSGKEAVADNCWEGDTTENC